MSTYIHIYIYIYIYTHIRGCQPPPPLSPRPDCMCESVYKYICIRTRVHIIYRCIFTHRHAYIQYRQNILHKTKYFLCKTFWPHKQTRIHTIHIHMHTHKYTCIYSHTNTHTYTYMTRLSAFTSALSEN